MTLFPKSSFSDLFVLRKIFKEMKRNKKNNKYCDLPLMTANILSYLLYLLKHFKWVSIIFISCRWPGALPRILQPVFPKNKGILLHNHMQISIKGIEHGYYLISSVVHKCFLWLSFLFGVFVLCFKFRV